MFNLIISVDDENEVVGMIPTTGEVWMKKMNPEDADFYRRRLREEIILRIYLSEMPGEAIGRYTVINPYSTTENNEFYFDPV